MYPGVWDSLGFLPSRDPMFVKVIQRIRLKTQTEDDKIKRYIFILFFVLSLFSLCEGLKDANNAKL